MTVVGNRERFAIEVVPVDPSWSRRYAPDRGPWAGLSIWAAGRNLCQHLFTGDGSVHEHVFVPSTPVAEWLERAFGALCHEERPSRFPAGDDPHAAYRAWADRMPPSGTTWDEWMVEREEWWRRHFSRSGSDGAHLPDIALVRCDDRLIVTWRAVPGAGLDPPQFTAAEGMARVPWNEGIAVLDEFVWQVLGRRPSRQSQGSSPERTLRSLVWYSGQSEASLTYLEILDRHVPNSSTTRAAAGESVDWDPASRPLIQVLRDSPRIACEFTKASGEPAGDGLPVLDAFKALDRGLDRKTPKSLARLAPVLLGCRRRRRSRAARVRSGARPQAGRGLERWADLIGPRFRGQSRGCRVRQRGSTRWAGANGRWRPCRRRGARRAVRDPEDHAPMGSAFRIGTSPGAPALGPGSLPGVGRGFEPVFARDAPPSVGGVCCRVPAAERSAGAGVRGSAGRRLQGRCLLWAAESLRRRSAERRVPALEPGLDLQRVPPRRVDHRTRES